MHNLAGESKKMQTCGRVVSISAKKCMNRLILCTRGNQTKRGNSRYASWRFTFNVQEAVSIHSSVRFEARTWSSAADFLAERAHFDTNIELRLRPDSLVNHHLAENLDIVGLNVVMKVT